MQEQCPVCAEMRKSKDLVGCPQCSYQACRACVRVYLLGSHHDAHCMSCRHAWSRNVLTRFFPKSFVTGEWKTHRANVLFEREKSLFPETMGLMEEDRRKNVLRLEIHKLYEKIALLQQHITVKRRELRGGARAPPPRERNQYVRPCIHENCKGFLDERSGECGLCFRNVCLACNTSRDEDHQCREDDVANWNHIRENTKPCPGCHARIHRVSGCRQMWCPQCHCAFDYVTGKVETGIIHNPHYFQYLQRTGAQAQAVGGQGQAQADRCGEGGNLALPFLYQFQRIVSKRIDKTVWMDLYRALVHTRQVEIPKYRDASTTPLHTLTLDLRKEYMLNEIHEARFKKRVQEREKKWLKEKEVHITFDTFLMLGTELVRSLHVDDSEEVWTQRQEQRNHLRSMFNERVQEINSEFQSRLLILNENFMFVGAL